MLSIEEKVRRLYNKYGQRKAMGKSASNVRRPHYFLHRTFFGDQDLLIIFNTKRCSYNCDFCQLPAKSSRTWISGESIISQFEYVIDQMKHSLSVLNRLTISNDGSVLDTKTFPTEALLTIARCAGELRLIRRIVLETRLEFVDTSVIQKVKETIPKATVNILTGFETQDTHLRDKILFKKEPLDVFLNGLDRIAKTESELTSYVLFKPSPTMTDMEAFTEAEKSINFLVEQCRTRSIPLSIRLNPMYVAASSKWAKVAQDTPDYKPPRLTDVMELASKKTQEGVRIYIGLSGEGLDETWGNYMNRGDYSSDLIKYIKQFNDRKISSFEGIL